MLLADSVTQLSGVWQRVVGGQVFVVSGTPDRQSDPVAADSPLAVRASSFFFSGA